MAEPAAPEAPAPAAPVEGSTVSLLDAKTGAPVALPAAQAQAAFKAGAAVVARDTKVHVKLADGRIGTVAPEHLSQTLDQGGTIMAPAEAKAAGLEKEYGGAKGVLPALGLGVARGFTAGLSDELLPSETKETAKFLKEKHDIASGVGVGGGMVLQSIALGGMAPGALAEGAAEGLVGEGAASALGRFAQKGIAHIAEGTAEGALAAHTDAISESALGDHKLTAEKYFAQLGEGALMGAGLGAGTTALGGLAKGAPAVARKLLEKAASPEDVEAVAGKVYGFVPKGLGDAYVKASGAAAGGGTDIIAEAGIQNQSAEAKALRAKLLNVEDVRTQAVRDVTDHVNTLLKGSEDVADEAKGVLKRDYLKKSVRADETEAVAAHSADTIASTRSAIQDMLAQPEEFGNTKLLAKMDKELGRYETQIQTAGEAGNNAEQFALLDDTKRMVGSFSRDLGKTLNRQIDPIAMRQARATFEQLGDVRAGGGIYEGLRKNLENPQVWGKAAEDQAAINAAWTEHIAASREFTRAVGVTSQVGEENFGAKKLFAADPEKVGRYVTGLVNPDKDIAHQAMDRYVRATKDLTGTIAERFDLPAAKAAQVKDVAVAADALKDKLGEIGETLSKSNQLQALIASEGKGTGLTGAVLGSVLGPIGGMAGVALDSVMSPGKNILRLAQVESMLSKFDQRVGGAVRKWLAPVERKAGKFAERGVEGARGAGVTGIEEARSAGQRVVAEAPHVAADFAKERSQERAELRASFQQRVATVDAWGSDPEMLQRIIQARVSELGAAAPNASKELAQTAARAAQFLQSKRPVVPVDPLFRDKGIPSDAEMEKYNRYHDAVFDPGSVVEHLKTGKVNNEEIEAIQAVYPNFYGQLQAMVTRELSSKSAEDVPYQKRVLIGQLFGVPAVPSQAPESAAHAQAVFAMPPQRSQSAPPGGKGKPLAIGSASKTSAQQIAAGPGG